MTRLPQPGSDNGQWGQILNAFLAVEHNEDGSLKKAADITAAQMAADAAIPLAQKGASGGVASLDSSARLTLAQLPASVETTTTLDTSGHAASYTTTQAALSTKAQQVDLDKTYSMALPAMPRAKRPVSGVIGYFGKAGHGWTANNGTTNLNDTSIPMIGTQSITLAPGNSSSTWIEKTAMPAFSIVGKTIRVVLRVSGNVTGINMYFASDNTLTNRISGTPILRTNIDPAGEDYVAEVAASDMLTTSGSPVLTAITMVRFLVATGPSGGTVSVGGIYLTDSAATLPNGGVVFSFDDSRIDHWLYARPKLAEYGYGGTVFPNIEAVTVGGPSYYNVAQLKHMQDVEGWEVGAHCIDTAHHVSHVGQTEDWLRDHAESLLSWMRANGFYGNSFAWPVGNSDALAQQVMADYFSSARGVVGYYGNEVHPATRPMDYRALNPTTYTLAQCRAFVDRAKSGHSVVHFLFHGLPTTITSTNDFARQDFYDLVDYVAAQGVPVYTQGQIMQLPVV
jgi:hypothetical protein